MRGTFTSRLLPLVAALAPSLVPAANTLTVFSCSDDPGDSGTLRNVVAAAMPGDTVDASHLGCSVITLTTGSPAKANGAIQVTQASPGITIQGPGAGLLAIDGANSDRVFTHVGTGELAIDGITIRNGYIDTAYTATPPKGGCVASYHARLHLSHTVVSDCHVYSTIPSSVIFGGAVYATDLSLTRSTITGNSVLHPGVGYTRGGGIYVKGSANIMDSTISNNKVDNGKGGGIQITSGNLFVGYSTVTGNYAKFGVGGIDIFYTGTATISASTITNNIGSGPSAISVYGAPYFALNNSTLSGNSSPGSGALLVKKTSAVCTNSTIAFNSGGGLVAEEGGSVDIESTILAKNTGKADLGMYFGTFSGFSNLVMTSIEVIPVGFLAVDKGTDPQLAPLRNNGGQTATHMLLPGSAARSKGNNNRGNSYDQRGPQFPRHTGAGISVSVDIGAVQFDTIYADGFDGGP